MMNRKQRALSASSLVPRRPRWAVSAVQQENPGTLLMAQGGRPERLSAAPTALRSCLELSPALPVWADIWRSALRAPYPWRFCSVISFSTCYRQVGCCQMTCEPMHVRRVPWYPTSREKRVTDPVSTTGTYSASGATIYTAGDRYIPNSDTTQVSNLDAFVVTLLDTR